MRKSITVITGFFLFFGLDAQYSGISCRHYNIQNGLLSNYIEFVHVDKEGYVWFASSNGLQQFDGYNFINYNYNTDDNSSIAYNFITSVTGDSAGNIWIGTLGRGLDIINKKNQSIHHIRNLSAKEPVLTSNIIPRGRENFVIDIKGNIWLNTDNGLNRINPENLTVEQFKGDFNGELLYDATENIIWIASNVLKKFNPVTKNMDYYQILPASKRSDITVNSFRMGPEGMLWLGTNSGLLIFDRNTETFSDPEKNTGIINSFNNQNLTWFKKPVESVFIDKNANIWLAIEKTIIKLNIRQGIFEKYDHEVDNPGSLLDDKISGIYGDGSGVLWVVYNSMGVSRMNTNTEGFLHYRSIPGNPNSLRGNTVRSVHQDRRGNLWVGNYSEGLNRFYSETSSEIDHYICEPDNPQTINSNCVTSIYVDTRERLWVGTFDKGFCFADQIYNSPALRFKRFRYDQNLEVQTFCEDSAGNIWIGTQEGLYIYDYMKECLIHYGDSIYQDPELKTVNIQSIIYSSPNIFWITSWNRGLCKLTIHSDLRLSPVKGRDDVKFFENVKDSQDSNIDNCFISICKDGNTFWLGSNVNGLVKMTLSDDGKAEFTKYDHLKGAPSNSVYATVKDKNGRIWISTNHGLGRFDPDTEKFYNYYENDGLLSNSFIWNSFYQNPEGKIFLGGVNGLIAFTPETISESNGMNNVHITRLIIKNKDIEIGDKVNGRQILTNHIKYTPEITLIREPAFSIEFVAVNPVNPQEVIYSYKLEGHDKEWNLTSAKNRLVTYSNLKQGTYTFLVKASNNPGDTDQKATSLNITVLPPWWQTTYALAGFTLIFVILLLLLRWLILTRIRLVHEAKYEHMERQKTEELFQFKMSFFTDISHEFGNLLSLILSPLQHIADKVGHDPDLAEQSKLIRKNSERLLRLTEQVIDMRKLDLNKMKFTLEKSDIIDYIRELTHSFQEIAVQRSIQLTFKSEPGSYLTWFDENKTDRIICNLLSNAFKYTPDGGEIAVNVKIIPQSPPDAKTLKLSDEPDEIIEISISDNGIGIPDKYKPHIFERFLQVDRSGPEIRKGTGIGLALTRELVELQKGSIRFESVDHKGTKFTVCLPAIKNPGNPDELMEFVHSKSVKPVNNPRLIPPEDLGFALNTGQNEAKTLPQDDKPVLLLVEDDREIRSFLRENLKRFYRIYEAENGQSGLETAIRIEPDIIVSDILMPVLNGIEMCRKIKTDPRTGHIPLILLTARTGIESKLESMDTGADAFIEKPFILDLLVRQMDSILKNRKVLINKFSKELVVKPSGISITSHDSLFLEKAISIVEQYIADGTFGPSEFAREIGISRSGLHRKLKALTSQTAGEFIQSIRMQRAADLIHSSQLTIEEISFRVGFNSPAYFTKCYKKHFGKTPTSYKSEKAETSRKY